MASLFPDFNTIKRLYKKPAKGELNLLDFLNKNLDHEFEIYFKPFINGDRPDIVILKKTGGVVIIEVKDWNLDDYYIDEHTDWYLKENDTKIKSPLSQVKFYKDNLYDLHIEGLLQKCLENRKYRSIVNTMVYFHFDTEQNITDFLFKKFEDKKYSGYQIFHKYIKCWGKDSLTKERLEKYLNKTGLDKPSKLFDDNLYKNFKRYLQPSLHKPKQGKKTVYSKEKRELIRSESKPRRKIKGLAGGGKTFVLAKRAVNAYLRTNSRVLILCCNLSLKNYIRDRINEVKEKFSRNDFYITNYHQFFKSEANNYNLDVESLIPFTDTDFFEPVKDKIEKYQAIFIDEVQDYKTEWLEIITKYFLEDTGEFVVFGDEKQNTYGRPLDENKEAIIKTIRGTWNRSLIVSKRFADEIGRLALVYQKELLSKKYTVDELRLIKNPTIDFAQEILSYKNFGSESKARDLYNAYTELIKTGNIQALNVTFLAAKTNVIREIDYMIRHELKDNTVTTFETKEYYEKLKNAFPNETDLKKIIENIRRNKKNHFRMKPGTTKLSTIQSFKGWESHTLILIIEPEDNDCKQSETTELIYTGITRARKNLFVFNMGNNFYDAFFKDKMGRV